MSALNAVAVTVSGPKGTAELDWPDDVAIADLLGPVARSCAGVAAEDSTVVVAGRGQIDATLSVRTLGLATGCVVNVFPSRRRPSTLPTTRAPADRSARVSPLASVNDVPLPGAVTPRSPLPPAAVARFQWVGAHGGAGVSTLAAATGEGAEGAAGTGLPAVVVARTHAHGLMAAQHLAAVDDSSVEVVGLVLVADAPGHLPAACQDLTHLVTGAYRHSWRIPWEARLRCSPYDRARLPSAVRRLMADLDRLTSPY